MNKAVIPAAGIGSRLLPVTKEMPKEMLPIFCWSNHANRLCLKPVMQVIFETIFDSGTRKFCIVVGRGKRAVEDYFSIDEGFVSLLSAGRNRCLVTDLSTFYSRIRRSTIVFVNQAEPHGFGHAVACSEPFVGSDAFLLHAGDDLILSPANNHVRRIKRAFASTNADAMFFVERTRHPEIYGVIRAKKISSSLYRVEELVEKPKKPPSDLGVIAIYALSPVVFEYLAKVKPDKSGEVQMADAVEMMIEDGRRVFALGLSGSEKRVDIGSPETYRLALGRTF